MCGEVLLVGKGEVGGAVSPCDVTGRKNKVARALVCLWVHQVR